ncbi:TetR/AcrR family transcriptional regulator [Micromonospora parathelypteridis]|uniref:AcrR family transcriptional regulator n=1 Tax=Micromonospora parathelypteridis TaxID=1839617 RepID=A0A840VQW2_9ACTN|nr:TetR/AcrR family transcriptional regulator [Micromonospora parathelypteridis]MBB5479067.1 AcrR family transcriptional regulator [Micromonospora parathelypteridis]GGO03195.1 TetR family transcriptional regulator [Micromonospora parathelypteridis]
MTETRTYHHGDLRRALLAAALEAIEEVGPTALSLRDLARRAGVSHAAPAHHFGDKAGLLSALAAQGFDRLAQALTATGDDLLEAGVAYVDFAVAHRAYFEVMFRPELYRADDGELVAARQRARAALGAGVAALPSDGAPADTERDALAAWSIAHGFATLWLAGALPARVGDDPREAARAVLRRLAS